MPNALGDSAGKLPSFLSNGNFASNTSFPTKDGHHNTSGKETSQPAVKEVPKPWVSQRCTDQARPLKVIYIGAGISGICGAIEFRKQVPNLELVIYEKNPELGGTWYENRYPGCACDVPAHAYQLTSESSPRWTSFFASAPEILQYWKDVATKYDIRKHMKFQQKCTGARWSETTNKWFVQLKDLATGLEHEDSADVLVTGEGVLNEWRWPDIDGISSFQGQLLHSANWDANVDLKGKSVAVIGNGSSGLQIVPAILPDVKHMDHYIRGKSWIVGLFGDPETRQRIKEAGGNFQYSPDEIRNWETDRESYLKYRRSIEHNINKNFGVLFSGTSEQANLRLLAQDSMTQRLKERPDIYEHLQPDFSPYCKRMSPGPGYLEALASPKVDTITSGIAKIDETGIITSDGQHRPVDVIICATGFQTSPASRSFPIYGVGGVNLRERFQKRPETYLSVCTDGFPNFFQSMGPNSMPGAGSLLLVIEKTNTYIAKILARMAFDNIARIEPKRNMVQAFTDYCDNFFKQTVFAEECNSWYKTYETGASRQEQKRGRITALWPGSSLHCVRTLSRPRWEDFEYKYCDDNEFGWFGNGWTLAEKFVTDELESLTWYLNDTNVMEKIVT
ncbi:sterigmatocystin biosynthesis monooxygenase stcW [Fusarium mexicanum]|uniref:Sterigmatocystin biosynthesis monooxygenase stcW n=1 Tax=Fusarium mexicanum TaxID=751941 RepID=A0A8H5J7X5_9HYPO|nr:sterigmatocystin biosynthesis monooxygenase stcW [Fusarium mexicanum]